MSHIVSFRVDGLAGRQQPIEVKLNRDTNIFFGLNGSGKTSLLRILHAAMSNETGILHSVPFTAAQVSIYSLSWDKVFTRSIERTALPLAIPRLRKRIAHSEVAVGDGEILVGRSESDERVAWSCLPPKPPEAASTRWAHRYLPTSRLYVGDEGYGQYFELARSGDPWLTEEQLDSFFARSVEQLWSRYSAQVLGVVREAQEQGLASILRAVLSSSSTRRRRQQSLAPAIAYSRVQNFLTRQGSAAILGSQEAFEERYAEDRTLQDVVFDIDSVEEKIEAAMTSRNRLQELIARMFSGNKEVHFADESIEVLSTTGDKIGLASLSSGEKHMLRILVQVLLAGESSMMIDEPELSLHIDWQKDLVESMRALNRDTQLILATHSPEIMADVGDDKIFRL